MLKYYRGIHLIRNGSSYYIYDIYGNIVATASATGTVNSEKEYNAFGVTEMSYEPFGYRGEYTDYETGYVYLRNRYYNPETGRFITEDPIRDGLNWYAYCNNNPIMFVDPWGLAEVPIRSYVENRGGSITFKEGITRLYFGAPLQNLNTSITVNMNGKSTTYYGFSKTYTIKSDGLAYIDDSILIRDFDIADNRIHTTLGAEEMLMICTVYGEAAGSSEAAWQAVANVIMNRVGTREWQEYKDVSSVIRNSGFDAYTYKNNPYKEADAYLKNRDGSNARLEACIDVVTGVYNGSLQDNTGGAVLYYSPLAQEQLYGGRPNWNFDLLTEITVAGCKNDDFKFYKYK